MQVHRLTLKAREGHEGKPLSGMRADVLLDGVRLKGVQKVVVHIDANSVCTAHIRMIVEPDVEANAEIKTLPAAPPSGGG